MAKTMSRRGYPDLEAADGTVYPVHPKLGTFPKRLLLPYAFLNVFSLLAYAICDYVNPAYGFLQLSWPGLLLGVYMFSACFPLIWMSLVYISTKRGNYFTIMVFGTQAAGCLLVAFALANGWTSQLKSAIALASVLFCVMHYTFLPEGRGSSHDYRVLGCIVLAAVMVMVVFYLIQVVFPFPEVYPPPTWIL